MENLLNDIYENLLTYYNDLVILLPKLLAAIIIFTILWMVANRSKAFATRRLRARMDDPLLAIFLARVIKTLIVIFAFLIVLRIVGLGAAAAGVLTTAGVGAFIIGFAFKDIGENFLAGILLAFNRPFRIGDTVELNGVKGTVVGLNLRTSHIKSFDGKDIYIPNANIIKNPVVNYTIDGFLRYDFTVGLDYGSDVNEAIEIILNTLKNISGILKEEKMPAVAVSELAASTLNLTAYYWLDTFDTTISGTKVKNEAVDKVLQNLWEAGFYTPGNVVEMKNYGKEVLKMGK